VINVFEQKKHVISISNLSSGHDLKELILKEEDKDINQYRIRLLYKGHEIRDQEMLRNFKFETNSQIQMSVTKLDTEEQDV
jgi:hypothetical protein